MAENTATAGSVTTTSQTAARSSFAAAVVFLVLLTALHFIKPELDPSWRMISEYEIGRYGWIMQLAFHSLAFSFVVLFVAIRSQIRNASGKIGLAFLLVAALGMTIAAIFTSDPMTASSDELTTRGNLHALGTFLGAGFPIAAALVSLSLTRNRRWSRARRSLVWSAVLAWVGFLAFALSSVIMFLNDGAFGPDVLTGWPNRFMMVTFSVWLMVVARQAIRSSAQQPATLGRAGAR